MSFWTPKKKFRVVLWIVQILIIFILSWIISSNFLWSASDDYKSVSEKYLETKEQYSQSNIAEEREQLFSNTLDYATASIDQMLNRCLELQNSIENFSWLADEDRATVISQIDEETQYLEKQRNQILTAADEDEVQVLFKPVFENWKSFKSDLSSVSREIFYSTLLKKCEGFSELEDMTIVDSDLELRRYADFTTACEDWKVEDVDLSDSLLEWIKVIE